MFKETKIIAGFPGTGKAIFRDFIKYREEFRIVTHRNFPGSK